MALKIDVTLDRKLTSAFKNDMRNLENFHQNTGKSKNCDIDGILLSKVEKCMRSKVTGEFSVMTMKNDKQNWKRN